MRGVCLTGSVLGRGAGIQIGDSKTDIECLVVCWQNLPLAVLQTVLPHKMYSKLVAGDEEAVGGDEGC